MIIETLLFAITAGIMPAPSSAGAAAIEPDDDVLSIETSDKKWAKISRILCAVLMMAVISILVSFCSDTVYAGYTAPGIPGSKSYVKKKYKTPVIILVGDSRTMMCTYPHGNLSARRNYCFCWVNGGNVKVIGKKGKLTPYVEKKIKKYKENCIVVFNMGVNGNSDPNTNAKRIIRIYRNWMKQYPKIPFYVVSVNPTLVQSGPYSNKRVIKLNKRLKEEFEPEGIYIDTYSVLMKSKLIKGSAKGMRDSIHYNWNVGRKVLNYIRKTVSG